MKLSVSTATRNEPLRRETCCA